MPTSSWTPWRWAVAGAFMGALLALSLGAPARWLATLVEQFSGRRVLLQDARGTVWAGSARLVLSGGPGTRDASALPDRLAWRWHWQGGGPGLSLSNPCCTPTPLEWQFTREEGRWQVRLQDQQSQWPLPVLSGLGAPWNTLQAQGQLTWKSQGLRLGWSEQGLLWLGQNTWQIDNLASRLSTLKPMGSYRIRLETPVQGSAQPSLTLETLSGPLQLTGRGQWTGQRLRLEGEASAEAGYEDALSNLLNIVGRRDGARSRFSIG